MAKAFVAVFVAFLVAIVAARGAYLRSTDHGDHAPNQAWAQDRMKFIAWNSEKWTAWVSDDAFEKSPQNTAKWHRHANKSIAFIGWNGGHWQAKIDGDEILLARNGDWQGDVDRALAIRYLDWSGNEQIRSLEQLRR